MFNKKEVLKLRREVDSLWATIVETQKDIRKLQARKEYFSAFEALPEDSFDYQLMKTMKAIIDYLGIEISVEVEENPNYLKPQPQMHKVYRAFKKKKSKSL